MQKVIGTLHRRKPPSAFMIFRETAHFWVLVPGAELVNDLSPQGYAGVRL